MKNLTTRFIRGGTLASGLLCLAGLTACGGDDDSTTPVKQPDPVVSPLPATAAAITVQPKTQSVAAGQPAIFSVAASGSGTLKYQWWRNGVEIAGATGATYTTTPVTLADSGDVLSVVVRNDAATVTSDAVALQVDGVGARVLAGGAIVPGRAQLDGVGKQAYFLSAGAIASDGAGNLLLVDTQSKSVRKITPAGVVTTPIAGPKTTPALQFPRDIAAGLNGVTYVTDGISEPLSIYVLKIAADNVISAVPVGTTPGDPILSSGFTVTPLVTAIAADAADAAGNVYVASEVARDGEPECSSCFKRAIVRKIARDGSVTTMLESLGPSVMGGVLDMAVDKSGNLFVINHKGIERLDRSGVRTTLVGTDQAFIKAITVDAGGNLYFATEPFSGRPSTWPAHAIGKIAPDGKVTVAADPNGSDARFKSAAWITQPAGLALDAAGALYVSGNGRVLKLVLP
ncbi:hypothetical protein INH39_20150 [Massilia violaceinigra]|uniref:Ig-like domain-containing protein n=1 Tax=Massilia violaceinigra TaxID=2045208 RepID=A0ABY3ZZA1_9BURK|nr:hypothetical protein [Massilia violaceinigra]UOD27797.1 hypothetical protein INH39_20150 [Massilia violaceinigra]